MCNEEILIKAIKAILSVAEANNLVRIKQICNETLNEVE
jgi:hypothetical protein